MPYCKHCGNKIVENARFCSSCSAPMDEESRVAEQERVIDNDNLYIDTRQKEVVDNTEDNFIGLMDLPADSANLLPRFKEPKKKGLFGLFKK